MRRALLAPPAALAALVIAIGAPGAATPPPTTEPGALTVGLALPSEGFQVGVVKGAAVIYAQGFEIDVAKALAKKLGLARTAFVQSRFDRLFSAGPKPFDLAIAQISITPARARVVDFSRPYMTVDQGVLVAQTVLPAPASIAALRQLRLCALAKSTGADVAKQRVRPVKPLTLIGNVPTLMLNLQTGRCDAVIYDAPALGTLKARAPARYGPFAGVIDTRESYGIALAKGSALLGPVDDAIAALFADGTIDRLATRWLTVDPADLRVLR